MKPISTTLAQHLQGETMTLATCWKITRRDAMVLGFTSHDRDLVIEGITYESSTGFTPSAIDSSSDFAVDNLDIEGMLSSDAITETEILAGHYDYAEIDIFLVNYSDLTQGALVLRTGWLGQIAMKGGQFTAEVRGLSQCFTQQLGQLYSPLCRAQLGDAKCGVALSPSYTATATITSVVDNRQIIASALAQANGFFTGGKITFTSGANQGIAMEVKRYSVGAIELMLAMPYALASGDSFTIHAGCDKHFKTCKERFNNAVNFRGEPHVPGIDRMLETAATV